MKTIRIYLANGTPGGALIEELQQDKRIINVDTIEGFDAVWADVLADTELDELSDDYAAEVTDDWEELKELINR